MNEVTSFTTSTFGPPLDAAKHPRNAVFARVVVYRVGPRSFGCGSFPRWTIYGWANELCRKCYVDVWRYFRGAR